MADVANHRLTGRKIWAVSIGHRLLDGVVLGLAQGGAQLLVLSNADWPRPEGVEARRIGVDSREAAARSVAEAFEAAGAPDLVVMSIVPEAAVRPKLLQDWDEAGWRACVADTLRATMWLLDALGLRLKANGGAIVLVAPSLSLVGAPQLVALTTLLEGQRGLVKSVARQWGAKGVRLNWIAAAPRVLSPVFDGAPLAVRPDAVSVAMGRPANPAGEIAPVIEFLASKAGRAFAGATLMLDGGEWMVP